MSNIAALPALSSASGSSSLATLKRMLGSDAAPVLPIRSLPEDTTRRQSSGVETIDDSDSKRRAAVEATRTRTESAGTGNTGAETPASDSTEEGPVTASAAKLSSGPAIGFVAQSISQETLGAGLHIEPWDEALSAYRRAEAGPATGPRISSLTI